MYGLPERQKGMTLTGWMGVIILILFFAIAGMKIVPIYLENYTVKEVVNRLSQEPLITKKSSVQVRNMIMRRLDMNGVYDLTKQNVSVIKTPGVMNVNITYTVQKNMFGNIDIIVSFSEETDLVSN